MRKIINSDTEYANQKTSDEDVSLVTQEITALRGSLRGNIVTFIEEHFPLLIFLFAYFFRFLIYLGTCANSS